MIIYPSNLKTNQEKLFALYPLFEQIYTINNEKAAFMKLDREQYVDKYRTYSRKISKPVLKELYAERNRLKDLIFKAEYPDLKAWGELSEENILAEELRMFGNKDELYKLSTKITYSSIPILQAVTLDSLPPTAPVDPVENFTSADWNNGSAQSDPDSDLTIIANKVTFDTVDRNYDCYFYRDFGANHFDGDFEHLFEFCWTADNNAGIIFFNFLSNSIDDARGIQQASGDFISSWFYASTYDDLRIRECDGGAEYTDDSPAITQGTLYYLEFERDEAVGAFGTIYLYIATDDYWDDGGTQIDTLSVALHTSKKDFRYLYAVNNYNSGSGAQEVSGYMQNLDIQEAAGPTEQACAGTITMGGSGGAAGHGGSLALYIKLDSGFTGAITSAGALIAARALSLAGTVTMAGTLVRNVGKVLAGTITSAGSLVKTISLKGLAGAVTISGALIAVLSLALSGAVTIAGAVVRKTSKTLSGTTTIAGVLTRAINVSQSVGSATVTIAGSLSKTMYEALAGTITIAGSLAANLIMVAVAFTLKPRAFTLTLLDRDFTFELDPRAFSLTLRMKK